MFAWIIKKKPQYCFIFACSFFLVSCSATGNYFQSDESISDYAEWLFKRQNTLTQQVMMSFEDEIDLKQEEKIDQAELQMHDACQLLNEYANREIEGKEMSVFFRRRVKNSFEDCDQSVQNLQAILMMLEIK